MDVEILIILKDNFFKFDWIIIVVAIINSFLYRKVRSNTNKIYDHFNPSDKLSKLPKEAIEKLKKNTRTEKILSANELMILREKMNKTYALYSNFTTIFPLLGMLGTVWNFFSALTSTLWGIIVAILFKVLDSTVSYKIEDNEKRIEFLLSNRW